MKRKKIIIISLLLAIIVGVCWHFYGKSGEKPTYITAKVKRGYIDQSVEATGEVFAENLIDVGAQVSGQIKKLYVKVGDKVKEGDPIAEIDSVKQENTLAQQEAALLSYQASLESTRIALNIAKKQYDRETALYKRNVSTAESVENARNTYSAKAASLKEIEAKIKQTQIEIDTAKTNLSYTKITAPTDGTVVSVPVEEGQTINAAQAAPTIAMIADLTKMEIKMQISEADVTKVKVGNRVEYFILSDVSRKLNASLTQIDPALTTLSDGSYSASSSSSAAVYYYAKVRVANDDELLRIGMTTQNKIITHEAKNTLFVSSLAVKSGEKGKFVLVKNGEKVTPRKVTTGIVSSVNTQILEGVSEGEEVVVSQSGGVMKRDPSGMRGGRVHGF